MHDRAIADIPNGPTNPYRPFRLEEVEQSIPARFAQQVAEVPDKVALVTAGRSLTYAELDEAANRLAEAILDRRGTAPEPVAFLVDRGCGQIIAILGILKAGKIYVPLDQSYPPARSALVLADAKPALIVTDVANRDVAAQLCQGVCPLVSLDEVHDGRACVDPRLPLKPDRPATIIYTSGSTGTPKGLVHSHRNILHVALKYTNNQHLCRDDRVALLYSCSFAGSIADIFSTLLNGATLAPFDLKRRGVAQLGRWLAEQQITLYQSVPTVFRQFVATLATALVADAPTVPFPQLRLMRLGGEPVTARDVDLQRRHFSPGCLLAISLGATEILGIRLYFVGRDTPLPPLLMPVGYALQDTEVRILDDDGQPTPPGQLGEMIVHSPYLALGYWGDPARSRTAFPDDRNRSGWRTYRLGDLGLMRPDGCLEYHGRKDGQVKIRGYRVELAEVESALLSLDGVKEAVVVGRDAVNGGQRLVAYVVPVDGKELATGGLRAALVELLPDHMIPAAFVTLPRLPTTPTGKVDRLSLPGLADARPNVTASYYPPTDPLQVLLTEIWQECLNVSPVGANDDFYELGGDSILAMEMALQCEALLGRTVPEGALLEAPTVARLARLLLERDPGVTQATSLVQAGEAGRRLFFWHGDLNGGGAYCQPLARHLGTQVEFIAVHPHGLSVPQIPASIEEMAIDRLQALRGVQPKGPYLLAGYCNGGLMAFEMARQLCEAGERVDFLAVIAPPIFIRIQDSTLAAPIVPRPHPPLPRTSSGAYDLAGFAPVERRTRFMLATHDVCAAFVMRRFPGDVLLILPEQDLPNYGPLERWHAMARHLEILTTPGGHATMLAARRLPVLANLLRSSKSWRRNVGSESVDGPSIQRRPEVTARIS